MAVTDQITELQQVLTRERTVLTGWGVNSDSSAGFLDLTDQLEAVSNNGAVSDDISTVGQTYTIAEGYHDGSGTVAIAATEQAKIIPDNIKSGVNILGVDGNYAGAGINLQQKTITPTKSTQNVQPDSGYDGLSAVEVNPIPAAYQDVSATTATAPDVLAGKLFTTAAGASTAGTMPNNGTLAATFDGLTDATSSYTLAAGYYAGGTVSLTDDIENALAALL